MAGSIRTFDRRTIYWAVGSTSTEVENCNVLSDLLNFSINFKLSDFLDFIDFLDFFQLNRPLDFLDMTYQLPWFLAFLTFQSHSGPLLHLIMLIMHRFWPFLAFKNAFLWLLNDPSPSNNLAESWKTFSIITICNIKSIQETKLQKMAKNLYFGSLDHSKMRFCDFRMTLYDKAMLPNVEKHLVLSQYATSSRSNRPKSRNWSKTSFLALWII